MPGQGTKGGGAMASRGRKERGWAIFMVAEVLLFSAALSKRPLVVSSDTGQVFYGSNGVNGSNEANGRCGVYGRDGRIWLIDRWLWFVWGIELQEAGN